MAFEAFEAAIFMCSWNLSCGSNQRLRYLIQLEGVTSFCMPGVFNGMHMAGVVSQFLDFVKCMSSFLTWSICSPLCDSHEWVSSNAIVLIWAVVVRSGPDVRMALSSTYSVIGESVIFLSFVRGLSSMDSSIHLYVLQCTSSIISDVK